jgi:hypothetical protein
MSERKLSVSLRLTPHDADWIYWELLALTEHYSPIGDGCDLEPREEAALRSAISQLELGLARAEAQAQAHQDHQLKLLRGTGKPSSRERLDEVHRRGKVRLGVPKIYCPLTGA